MKNLYWCHIFFFISLFSTRAQSQSLKQKDSMFLQGPFMDKVQRVKKPFANNISKYKGNKLSLYGALSLNQQIIDDNNFTAPVNYLYNSINSNAYKPGYSAGFRWDARLSRSNFYTIIFGVNRINAGNSYKNKYSIAPFPEEFTHFRADNNYTTLSVAVHLRKLLPINEMDKYKFYLVAGPSFDYKISKISNDNLLNGASNRSIMNADLGGEFDNKGYYVLFAHYKMGMNLFNSSVPIRINRFEIGMSIKAKDLF